MYFFEKLKHLQKKFYIINPFFSIQFLFVWVVFKILGFFGFSFFVRVGLSIFSFIILLFYWEYIIPKILSNIFFQYYLAIFYNIVNFLTSIKYGAFLFGIYLGGLGILLPLTKFYFNNNFFLISNINYCLFLILMFSFFRRFNRTVIIPEIAKGFNFQLVRSDCLHWADLINLMSSYFIDNFLIPNRLTSFPKLSFENFPFSMYFMDQLKEIGFNNAAIILHNTIKNYNKKNLTEDQKKLILKYSIEDLRADFLKKQQVNEQAALIAYEINNNFYWGFILGLIVITGVLFFLLNFS
jgi:hypothetical protein